MNENLWEKCPNCNGIGKINDTFQDIITCPTCKGKGIINKLNGLPPVYITVKPFNFDNNNTVPKYLERETNITSTNGVDSPPLQLFYTIKEYDKIIKNNELKQK